MALVGLMAGDNGVAGVSTVDFCDVELPEVA